MSWSAAHSSEDSARDSFLYPHRHDLFVKNGGFELHTRVGAAERFYNPTDGHFRTLIEPADTRKLSGWTTENQRYGRPDGSKDGSENVQTLERKERESWMARQKPPQPGSYITRTGPLSWVPGKD
mmetsp:Transcript_23723/g.45177  ORF Transcript_23723/g.45177 Transcript_23723/m.45177 type:complete len:125 (+) Transcript_23723:259-633(+)|eukprot:CAMPEP_0114251650 /NCGR_PEP_ID=MMETSP0058-20121206/15388_1 /TAXON_ID=36894 /ORGANISM="Pyramimonas parkeae, CCMP726" /LENGTH=124 /DNA_ID=CAMNT_0001365475 /DNA_START=248 /DNA_END=622 /DNA_ORIENTATION=+